MLVSQSVSLLSRVELLQLVSSVVVVSCLKPTWFGVRRARLFERGRERRRSKYRDGFEYCSLVGLGQNEARPRQSHDRLLVIVTRARAKQEKARRAMTRDFTRANLFALLCYTVKI